MEEPKNVSTDIDVEFVENLRQLLRSGERGMVLNLAAELYPADLARLFTHLPYDETLQLFRWLPSEPAADVLAELDDDFRTELLEDTKPGRLTALLDELDTDDATDILGDLPEEVVQQVLPQLEAAADLEALLGYDEESAGGIMGTEYVAVPDTWTVAEATEEVRRNAETVEAVFAVFVVDEERRLRGIVSLKDLLLKPSSAIMGDIMREDFISVPTDMDQEEVARIMERYDLVSLPVIDALGVLVGRITIDDVVDVIREEAEEDIQRMSGVAGGEEATDSIARIIKGRLPWLIAGLVGASLAASVIVSFEDALAQTAILAAFIPIVMATAGNAGIQSSAIAVQGLASGDVWDSDIVRRLGKELIVALGNGVAVAVVLGVMILGFSFLKPFDAPIQLAYTAGLALLLVIILATTIGATTPLLLHRLNIDPALATGPFITTSNDILGILIFFMLAELLYVA